MAYTCHRGENFLSSCDAMTETVSAWQCIGCGKIEAPQTCVGICQDRKVEFVYLHSHREAMAFVQAHHREMERLVRQVASVTPRTGEWERTYRALQEQARNALTRSMDVFTG